MLNARLLLLLPAVLLLLLVVLLPALLPAALLAPAQLLWLACLLWPAAAVAAVRNCCASLRKPDPLNDIWLCVFQKTPCLLVEWWHLVI